MANRSSDTNYILTGIAMLTAMWDSDKHDVLDALTPYIKYAAYKETKDGNPINPSKVASRLDRELGYQQFDPSVVEIALRRLAREGTLKRDHRKYYFDVDLTEEVERMDCERLEIRRSHERVGEALSSYLNEHYLRKEFDQGSALQALTMFFSHSGMLIVQDPKLIESIPKSDDKLLYHVGQFVLHEYDNDSTIFTDIERMVKGFFVSTAIYAQPTTRVAQHFKDTTIYLDTHILLCALGILSDEQRDSKAKLIMMMNEHGAKTACFQETHAELVRILNAYKHSLSRNPSEVQSSNTLPGFDGRHFTARQVDAYIATLQQRLSNLNVEICPLPLNGDSVITPIDREGLRIALGSVHHKEKALQHDLNCVESICILRRGSHPASLEKCGALFLTSNPRVMDAANRIVGSSIRSEIQPVMNDTEFAAILWLKTYSTHGDYPKIKLIENAAVALYPSDKIMSAFYNEVDKAKSDGLISVEAYQALRVGLFQRRELMHMIDGDEANITEKTVEEFAHALPASCSNEDSALISELNTRLDAERRNQELIKERALQEITAAGKERQAIVLRVGKKILCILLAVTTLACILAIIISYTSNEQVHSLLFSALLVIDCLGAYDMIFGKRKVLESKLEIFAGYLGDKAKEKKRIEYSRVFDEWY